MSRRPVVPKFHKREATTILHVDIPFVVQAGDRMMWLQTVHLTDRHDPRAAGGVARTVYVSGKRVRKADGEPSAIGAGYVFSRHRPSMPAEVAAIVEHAAPGWWPYTGAGAGAAGGLVDPGVPTVDGGASSWTEFGVLDDVTGRVDRVTRELGVGDAGMLVQCHFTVTAWQTVDGRIVCDPEGRPVAMGPHNLVDNPDQVDPAPVAPELPRARRWSEWAVWHHDQHGDGVLVVYPDQRTAEQVAARSDRQHGVFATAVSAQVAVTPWQTRDGGLVAGTGGEYLAPDLARQITPQPTGAGKTTDRESV